jgi:YfiH family protein
MLTFSRRISDEYSVRLRFSDRSDGDACLPTFLLSERSDLTVPSQVHGAEVFTVGRPGAGNGTACDALLTTCPGALLGVRTADCVPIAIYGVSFQNTPIVGAIHAGWRGICAGVIDNTVRQVRGHGAHHVRAIIGPHISTDHYEFGAVDLGEVVAVVGDKAVGSTKSGRMALDLGAAVREQLVRNSVIVDHHICRCTASDGRYWSHRADGDAQRSALIVDIRRSL